MLNIVIVEISVNTKAQRASACLLGWTVAQPGSSDSRSQRRTTSWSWAPPWTWKWIYQRGDRVYKASSTPPPQFNPTCSGALTQFAPNPTAAVTQLQRTTSTPTQPQQPEAIGADE